MLANVRQKIASMFWSPPAPPPVEPMARQEPENLTFRRWESAETTRLNQHQWCGLVPTSINADIEARWQTLVARCRHERSNNPMVEGVVETFSVDVVGEKGPNLIVESSNEDYNRTLKQVWSEWFSNCEVSGLHGVDLLRKLVAQDFDTGDWMQQLVDFKDELPGGEIVTTRLLDFDPIRCWTPSAQAFADNIVAGVQRDSYGRVTHYHVRDPKKQFTRGLTDWGMDYQPIVASDILHCFKSRESGQARGFPRLASVLQEIADLRDYDYQVLDAARTAANNGMLLHTDLSEFIGRNPKPMAAGLSVKLERMVAKYIAPGYRATAMTPTQPSAQYIDFRHEKLRSLGRVVSMPLLMVLLSAEESNFSQSRIDLNVIYQRGLNAYQQWVEVNWLVKLLAVVLRESKLAFAPGMTTKDASPFMLPRAPQDVVIKWGWEPIKQADQLNHVKTQTERIILGLTSVNQEISDEGGDENTVLESLARTQTKRLALGLPPLHLTSQKAVDESQNEQDKASDNGAAASGTKGKGSKRANRRRAAREVVNA